MPTKRWLARVNTRPIASTPSSTLRRTSSMRVMPQNLIRVLTGACSQTDLGREIPVCGIARAEKREARRRRGRSRFRAIASGQQFAEPRLALLAAADRQQRSDDVAHHVMQERVRLDL